MFFEKEKFISFPNEKQRNLYTNCSQHCGDLLTLLKPNVYEVIKFEKCTEIISMLERGNKIEIRGLKT